MKNIRMGGSPYIPSRPGSANSLFLHHSNKVVHIPNFDFRTKVTFVCIILMYLAEEYYKKHFAPIVHKSKYFFCTICLIHFLSTFFL